MKKTILAVAVAVGLAMGASAHAELVVNGGFETGDLTGWTNTGNFTGVDTSANTGTYAAYLGTTSGLGHLFQTISTIAGTLYDFSFAYASDGGTPNAFTASFDGNTLFSTTNDPVHGYQNYNFAVVASTNSTVIDFGERNDPSYLHLDDVSVNASAVPEPETLALLGLGLLGVAASRRKSAKSNNA